MGSCISIRCSFARVYCVWNEQAATSSDIADRFFLKRFFIGSDFFFIVHISRARSPVRLHSSSPPSSSSSSVSLLLPLFLLLLCCFSQIVCMLRCVFFCVPCPPLHTTNKIPAHTLSHRDTCSQPLASFVSMECSTHTTLDRNNK